MSKLRCSCGYVISDSTDHLSYKAYFVADEDLQDVLERTGRAVDAVVKFIEARERGEQEQCLAEHRLAYAGHSLATIIEELIGLHDPFSISYEQRTMYECEECGRILLEAGPKNYVHLGYVPETNARGILRSKGADTAELDEQA